MLYLLFFIIILHMNGKLNNDIYIYVYVHVYMYVCLYYKINTIIEIKDEIKNY